MAFRLFFRLPVVMLRRGLHPQFAGLCLTFQIVIGVNKDFNPAVQAAAGLGFVGCNRSGFTETYGRESVSGYSIGSQKAGNGLCTALGEQLVALFVADAVGMALNHHVGVVIIVENACELLEIVPAGGGDGR